MPKVVVTGGGVCGLLTAMLLARTGNDVTVLERDPMPPPHPDDAWERWERRGVNQFRMLHFLLPRFRQIVSTELPEVVEALEAAGALRFSFLEQFPEFVTGGLRPGDERFAALTGRRPVLESAVATAAATVGGVTVRRGVGVAGLLTGPEHTPGIPHVVGVRTEAGEDVRADLVVDATGRRSPLPRWLADIGGGPVHEELEDCGFVYYGRHYRSADGSLPPPFGPPLQEFGSLSVLTLPADHGTWGVGVVTSAADKAMRPLKDAARWEAVVRECATVAHWLDGEPLEDVAVMAKIEDRYRRLVVDGRPAATGIVTVADSWACTNPSVGRGVSIGLLHTVLLRDTLVKEGLDDPTGFVLAFDAITAERVEPWFRDTLWGDRHRLASIDAAIEGRSYETDDERWRQLSAVTALAGTDPDILRTVLSMGSLMATKEEVLADTALVERALAAEKPPPPPGPSRERVLELLA